jgi:methionyl-tRNA formyltransferase
MSVPVPTVFLGSGEFAVPVLARLAQLAEVRLRGVITAPPRPAGRGRRGRISPAGAWAADAGLPTLTPERLRAPDSIAAVQDLAPDLLILADYGQIVPAALLDLPRHGALNLHPSLLPRHRGATPVSATILAGDAETGVSLMRMDAGLDTGPLIAQRRTPVAPIETAPDLEARLAQLAADLLAEALPGWLAGTMPASPQPGTGMTLTRPHRRDDGRLDASRAALQLERQVRAYRPWPGSFLETAAGRLIVRRAAVVSATQHREVAGSPGPAARPPDPIGSFLVTSDGELGLVTGDGVLRLLEVQPAGGRAMSGRELLRGRPGLVGTAVLAP